MFKAQLLRLMDRLYPLNPIRLNSTQFKRAVSPEGFFTGLITVWLGVALVQWVAPDFISLVRWTAHIVSTLWIAVITLITDLNTAACEGIRQAYFNVADGPELRFRLISAIFKTIYSIAFNNIASICVGLCLTSMGCGYTLDHGYPETIKRLAKALDWLSLIFLWQVLFHTARFNIDVSHIESAGEGLNEFLTFVTGLGLAVIIIFIRWTKWFRDNG